MRNCPFVSVSPEFLGFPVDLEVPALLGDPETQKSQEDGVMTNAKKSAVTERESHHNF